MPWHRRRVMRFLWSLLAARPENQREEHHIMLQGKVALVTGAASGIGEAIAIEMGKQGARVVINYHSDTSPGQPVVDRIIAAGGQAIAIQADVSNASEVSRMIEQ